MISRRTLGSVLVAVLALVGVGCGGGSSGSTGCTSADSCPGTDGFCGARTCTAGTCGWSYTAAETPLPAPSQTAGDCHKAVCDGAGGIKSVADDTDVHVDGNVCTSDLCTAGVATNPPVDAGTVCGTGLQCDGAGACVGCLAPSDCPGTDTTCRSRTCTAGTCGFADTTNGTTCTDGDENTTGDVCTDGVCAGVDHCVGVTCSALDQCHDAGTCIDHATGACSNPKKADDTTCNDGDANTAGDVCTDGVCAGVDHCVGVTCALPDQCHDAGTCTDHATGDCTYPEKPADTACDDGNPCTADACSAGACIGSAVDAGTSCGSALACDGAGACHGAPAVISTTPEDGASALASTTVRVTFDQPMDPATLTGQVGLGACSGSIQVSANEFATCAGFTATAPTMSSGNTAATLTPSPGLLINRTYKVRVTTAAEGANTLALAAEYTSTTGFDTTSPISGTGSAWNESSADGEVKACVQSSPDFLTSVAGSSTNIRGWVIDDRYAASYADLVAQVGYGPTTSNPEYQSGWTWAAAPFDTMVDTGGGTADTAQYVGAITLPAAGTYVYAFRVSLDGGDTWTYCDGLRDDYGSGSNPLYAFDLEDLSVMLTVP